MGDEQGRAKIERKAEAFDRILERYLELQQNSDFYSKNWVELGQLIEAEQRRVAPPSRR